MLGLIPSKLRWQLARKVAWARYHRDAARGHPKALAQFKRKLGYDADLIAPRSHNERILTRKLFDHDPRFVAVSDKVAARGFIDDVLGAGQADRLCVPILAQVDSFADLPKAIWSQDVILKCTHGSAMNCIVKAGDEAARKTAKQRIDKWLGRVHGIWRFEWSYIDLLPTLIAEPLLNTLQMSDLKLYCYDGTVRFMYAKGIGETQSTSALLTPDWEYLEIEMAGCPTVRFDRPSALDDIVKIAARLGAGFDTIRVDFLMAQDRFYLGELTVYDASGLGQFRSKDEDDFFGQHWRQPHLQKQMAGQI
jgi:hypothetical protein